MINPICSLPYASLATVQYQHSGTALSLWVFFRFPMDQTVKPPLAKWIVKVDGVNKTPLASSWQDAYTLALAVINIPAHPAAVLLKYDGPHEDLRISWQKQWEPFGFTVAGDVPFNWEHILEVDVPNERVTINGVLALTHLSILVGVYTELDISGANVIFFDCAGGDIILNSFTGGINGQVLHLAKTTQAGNDVTLKHFALVAGQRIFLHAMGDETLTGQYGGWTLVCNGTSWFDLSHAKHV